MIYNKENTGASCPVNNRVLKFTTQSVNQFSDFSIMNFDTSIHPAVFRYLPGYQSTAAHSERMGEIDTAYLGNGTIAIIP
jgi:hypothetical protein